MSKKSLCRNGFLRVFFPTFYFWEPRRAPLWLCNRPLIRRSVYLHTVRYSVLLSLCVFPHSVDYIITRRTGGYHFGTLVPTP